ncbi:MAG: acylphosphatase [Candidatus Aenigmarchaeota archaeon]|nr:acylphosphatase [Candidatus Aenigmarchaeota archaeon]
MVKEVEFIVSGEVQGVGYRQYVAKIGRRLKLAGFAENLKDGTVRIHCKGDEKAISEFKKQINVKRPDVAPIINVENIMETQLAEGTINESIFEEKYSDSTAEMAQGFSTGMNYMNLFRVESHANFNRVDTNFNHMDAKYDKISEGMFAVVANMEKRMEKTDKNIESLLKVLTQKKG